MRVLALVSLLWCASAFAEERPLRLAIPGLKGVNVSEEMRTFYAEHLAQNLRAPGLTVVTAREIQALLGLERQKQLLGCGDESSSCIAELANALGADALVLGDVARFDDTFQINVKAVASADAAVLAQGSRRVRGEVATLEAMTELAHELARAVFERKGRKVPVELRAAGGGGSSTKTVGWVSLVGGAVVGGGGGVLLGLAQGDYAALSGTGSALTEEQALALRDGGVAKRWAGGACVAVGATAVAIGLGLLIFGPGDAPSVSVAPTPGGASLVVSGVLP